MKSQVFKRRLKASVKQVLYSGKVHVISYMSVYIVLLCSLDPEQKDMLIEVIEKLLADKTTVRISQCSLWL